MIGIIENIEPKTTMSGKEFVNVTLKCGDRTVWGSIWKPEDQEAVNNAKSGDQFKSKYASFSGITIISMATAPSTPMPPVTTSTVKIDELLEDIPF